jgi:hypothetical protein
MTAEKQSTPWQRFDAAYKKACESSQPTDWMNAALLAQQVRTESESALKNTAAPVTETGPLGGFATTTPEAAQLDFLLTQWQMEIEGAAEVDTAEEAVHHDAEALKIKREIIERYTPRSATPRKALVEKVAKFADLPEGWNSYDAKAFSERTVLLAMEIAELLDDEWGTVPVADGSIWFTRNNEDDIIEVRSNDE